MPVPLATLSLRSGSDLPCWRWASATHHCSYPFIFAAYDLTLEDTPSRLGRLFFAIPTGLVLCTLILVPLAWVDYHRCIARAGLTVTPPEARLRAAMLGTWTIPAGLLWT